MRRGALVCPAVARSRRARFRRSSQRETGPLTAKIDAAPSSSQGTKCRNVFWGVFSNTIAPAVPPSRPAIPINTASPLFLRTSGQYAATEVNCPGQIATVFVALACTGSIFMLSMAGKDRNDPPPATAFKTPARKVATTSHTQCQSIACQSKVAANPQKCMKRIVFEPTGLKLFADSRPAVRKASHLINSKNSFPCRNAPSYPLHMPALPFRQIPIAGLLVAALSIPFFAIPSSLAAQSALSIAPQQCVWKQGDDIRWAATDIDESGWQPAATWRAIATPTPNFWLRCHFDPG